VCDRFEMDGLNCVVYNYGGSYFNWGLNYFEDGYSGWYDGVMLFCKWWLTR